MNTYHFDIDRYSFRLRYNNESYGGRPRSTWFYKPEEIMRNSYAQCEAVFGGKKVDLNSDYVRAFQIA